MNPRRLAVRTLIAAATALAAAGVAAKTFKVAVGDAQGGTQWELATTFKTAFECLSDIDTSDAVATGLRFEQLRLHDFFSLAPIMPNPFGISALFEGLHDLIGQHA